MNPIERGWYDGSLLNYLLAPLSLLFLLISTLRRVLFKLGVLKSYKATRPVIVVGNISVGGNGKTPFVIWLVERLKAAGYKPGVISRGYGGKSEVYPIAVDDSLDTGKFGDEPVLIYQRTGCPVVVGSDRVANCDLLTNDFDCDIIISDDGLQHYRLKRDIEIVIVDAARKFGNGWPMPVGPLRELPGRLNSVDFVVYNGETPGQVSFSLEPGEPINMIPGHHFSSPVHGVCGIGNPQRFKNTLQSQGFEMASFTPFADHHHYTADDFVSFGEQTVLMTEKDAVKCRRFAQPNWWYLPVDAKLPQGFEQQLLQSIEQVQ